MRNLPAITTLPTHDTHSYYSVELATSSSDFGLSSRSIGLVKKVGLRWSGDVTLVVDGEFSEPVYLGWHATRDEAVQALRMLFAKLVDEREAYEIQVKRVERTLPAVVKSRSLLGRYNIELAKHEDGTSYRISEMRRLGFVEDDGRRWYAYARRTDAKVSVALGFYKTLKAAAQAVTKCFVRMLAEVEAHEIQDVIKSSQARADQDTRAQDVEEPFCLIWPMGVQKRITNTNEELAYELSALRPYVGQGLGTLREFDINAYVIRMIELELERRGINEQQATVDDEFGGDFDGYADAMYRRETGEL